MPNASEPSEGLPSLRWLAARCGVAASSTPLGRLASDLLNHPEHADATRDYVTWWMRHPDEGSAFEQKNSQFRDLPDDRFLSTLMQREYEGLIFMSEGEIAGHVFFQQHGSDLCAFSEAVTERFRGGRRWATFLLDYIAYAASLAGIRRASVGTGRNDVARLVVKLLEPHASELGWQAGHDGWIHFHPPANP